MKRRTAIAICIALAADTTAASTIPGKDQGAVTQVAQMGMMGNGRGGMMGGGMMGRGSGMDMRSMMQRMMGDVLPPAIDRSILPDGHSEGATALVQACSQCHNFPGPGMHTAQEWPDVVARMTRRENMMAGMMGVVAPTTEQIEALTSYLQAHAQRPLDERKYGDLRTSQDGKAFSETCGQCHALPDPSQHTASEWPAVVARMLGHEHQMHKNAPDDQTATRIIDFLRRHAS